jgi:methylenetetrahydrofolate dehydrogenase (NADP+) / methenyltetrahydrofolate cyclohydrolase
MARLDRLTGRASPNASSLASRIDIGINHVVGEDGQSRIVGDVDTDAVKEVASWVTPVPGGVGPVTVAMFMRNAIIAHEKQLAAGWLG